MNSILKERVYGGEFLLSDANGEYTRESITIGASQALKSGSILGKILRGAVSVVAAAVVGTGNGAIAALTADAGAPGGAYTMTITGGTHAVAVGQVVGAGNGVLTMANPAFGAAVIDGGYQLVCVEEAVEAGHAAEFEIRRPNGSALGRIVVGGAAFDSTEIKIASLTAGATPWAAGAIIPVVVSPAVPADGLASFRVTRPDNTLDGVGVVGTPYNGNGTVNFTQQDGDANFVVGDHRTITVTYAVILEEDQVCVAINPDAHDGSETFAAILWDEVVTAADETAPGAGVVRGPCEVIATRLDFGTLTDEQIAAVKVQIAAKGIVIR